MPFHPAIGVRYRGGLPAGITPPISFGSELSRQEIEDILYEETRAALIAAGLEPSGVIDERQPGGLFYSPPTPVPLVGLGLAAIGVLVFALRGR